MNKVCEKRIEEIRNGDHYKFTIEEGRKYLKIIQTDTSGGGAVHAFVDKKTGELYKAASWRGPAKDVRFDLRLIQQREWVLENCDWAGRLSLQMMTAKEKLLFVTSFIWFLHWGTCLASIILDTVILKSSVRMLPVGF